MLKRKIKKTCRPYTSIEAETKQLLYQNNVIERVDR